MVVGCSGHVVFLPGAGVPLSRSLYASCRGRNPATALAGAPDSRPGATCFAVLVLLRFAEDLLPVCAQLPGSLARGSCTTAYTHPVSPATAGGTALNVSFTTLSVDMKE